MGVPLLFFTIDERTSATGACNTCCCATATARPGETNKWVLDYFAWSGPIGGRGLAATTQVSVERISPDVIGTNQPPRVAFMGRVLAALAPLTDDLKTVATDPEGGVLSFALVPSFGVRSGTLTLNPDGTFTYVPFAGFAGVDRFFYVATDVAGNATVGEVGIRVNAAVPAVQFPAPTETPRVSAARLLATTSSAPAHALFLTVAVSPAVRVGEVWRVTVSQETLDCDCNRFNHVSCYDLAIVKC